MVDLSVILPIFNEADSLEESVSRLINVLEEHKINFELVLIDDGSPDNSGEIAQRIATTRDNILAHAYQPNKGKGAAILSGFERSQGKYIAFFDSDLDIHPECIPMMFSLVSGGSCDVAIGSKIHRESQVVYPRIRRIQSSIFRMLNRALFRFEISDTQTGAKVFKREALEPTLPFVVTQGFAHDLELLVRVHELGTKFIEVPVKIDFQFSSSVSVTTGLEALKDVWRIYRADRRGEYKAS